MQARRNGASLRPGGPGGGRGRACKGCSCESQVGAASRLLGDEEAEAKVSAVAEGDGAGDWLRED